MSETEAKPIDRWVEGVRSSLERSLEATLGCESQSIEVGGPDEPSFDGGAYISIAAGSEWVQVGIRADEEGRRLLSRAINCLEDDEADLPAADVRDALKEFSNVLAGAIATYLAHQAFTAGRVQLGIPIFMYGRLEPGNLAGEVIRVKTDKGDCVVQVTYRDSYNG